MKGIGGLKNQNDGGRRPGRARIPFRLKPPLSSPPPIPSTKLEKNAAANPSVRLQTQL